MFGRERASQAPIEEPADKTEKVGWLREARNIVRDKQERREIQLIRDGQWVGEPTWVVPSTTSPQPQPFPEAIKPEQLSGAQLRVAVRLGYLTFETMTREQLHLYEQSDEQQEVSAAREFIRLVHDAQVRSIRDSSDKAV